jgi:hypothetical protein
VADPKWEKPSYFDTYNSFGRLRSAQMSQVTMVMEYGDLFVGELRKRLLNSISLYALVCGAGKTLLIMAVLFAINEQVNRRLKNSPRPTKVLWFVKERELAVMLKLELDSEITRINLHYAKPSIQICDESGDLDRGPMHHDITISCPHALWKRKSGTYSNAEVCGILAGWDVIIWDECDFADDQMLRLAKFAPHALKFGLTASPINASGEVLKHFVLAGYATYNEVYRDNCLKHMFPWDEACAGGFVRKVGHEGFTYLSRGIEETGAGQHKDNSSLPGSMAAIRAAISDSYQLEQQMRREWPEWWFSPHLMVFCNSREECDHLMRQTNDWLRAQEFEGPGWRATAIYDNYKSEHRAEKRLFHKDPNIIHPFMRAKREEQKGRCDEQSARILFVVDMAIRGMNCWPLLYLVDIKRGGSVNVQVQTKGRDSRWPYFLSHLVSHPRFNHFCTGRYYVPESGGPSGEMEAAFSFILNMENRLLDANLRSWYEVLRGERIDADDREPQGTENPFSQIDQVQVDCRIGEIVKAGRKPTPDEIDAIIESLPGDKPKDRRQRARDHIEKVIDPTDKGHEYRQRVVDTTQRDPIRPISQEIPKPAETYTLPELKAFLEEDRTWSDLFEQVVRDIETSDTVRMMVAQLRRRRDLELYRAPPKVLQLQEANGRPGILRDIAKKFTGELLNAGAINRASIAEPVKAINTAAAIVAGMENIKSATRNDGPLDRPGYHHVFLQPSTQRRIRKLAIGVLLKRGVLASAMSLYNDVLDGADDDQAAA